MNPAYLGTLVFIGSNQHVYMPPSKDIWQRYLRKFSKNGKLLEANCGFDDNEAPPPEAPPPATPAADTAATPAAPTPALTNIS